MLNADVLNEDILGEEDYAIKRSVRNKFMEVVNAELQKSNDGLPKCEVMVDADGHNFASPKESKEVLNSENLETGRK